MKKLAMMLVISISISQSAHASKVKVTVNEPLSNGRIVEVYVIERPWELLAPGFRKATQMIAQICASHNLEVKQVIRDRDDLGKVIGICN